MSGEGEDEPLAAGRRRAGVATQLNSHSLLLSSTASHLAAVTDVYGANNGLFTPRKPFMAQRDLPFY